MTVYSATYNFNKTNNRFTRILDLKNNFPAIAIGASLILSSIAFSFIAIKSYNSISTDDNIELETNKQYLSITPPIIPERITPPRFAPFKKDNGPIHLSLKLSHSFADTLLSYGIPQDQIFKIQQVAEPFIDLKRLRANHVINVKIAKNIGVNVRDIDESMHIVRTISLYASPGVRLVISGDGVNYTAKRHFDKIHEETFLAAGKINSSIAVDAGRAGASPRIIQQFVKLFSLNVDFRQLQKNDSFELAFDKFTDENGQSIGSSGLTYASLTVNGKKNEIFYIRDASGKGVWINEKGMNNKPLLMKTPIDGARLSSGFGFRRHPILGYTKQHAGIDFAAPTGTPIYAAGDGTIVQRYRSGSYGNYVKVRHNNLYDTAYAHMSRFAKFSQGQRVSQGDIIGYVGTTGRSTGPHLHYEVHKNGVPINPLSDKVPTVSTVTVAMKENMKSSKKRLSDLRSGKKLTAIYKTINDVKYKLL